MTGFVTGQAGWVRLGQTLQPPEDKGKMTRIPLSLLVVAGLALVLGFALPTARPDLPMAPGQRIATETPAAMPAAPATATRSIRPL